MIKRVAALAGDEVICGPNGIRVNGAPASWIRLRVALSVLDLGLEQRWTIGSGQVFLVGDHAASFDSRHFGPVSRASITGRVLLRYWPDHRRGRIH